MSLPLSNIINFESFRTEAAEWRRFGKIFFLVTIIPVALLMAAVEFVARQTGETIPPETAAVMQAKDPTLMWMGYRDVNKARFKLTRVDQLRPDILIMGNSRASQFRRDMFKPYTCYNMSKLSVPIGTYVELLRHLPKDYTPKVIIFNLDFFQFNPKLTANLLSYTPVFEKHPRQDQINARLDTFRALYENPLLLFADRHDPTTGQSILGLSTHISMNGIRADGSETYAINKLEASRRDPEILHEYIPGNVPMFYADAMDPGEMAKFEEFVTLAHAKGIALIGIQMPIYGPIVHAIEQNPRYGILKDFRAHVADGYFDRLGVIFFDYLDFPGHGQDPHYFCDIHPNEPLSVDILLKMSEDPRVKTVLADLDIAALQRKEEEDAKSHQHLYLYNN